jgi:hypothetical protein
MSLSEFADAMRGYMSCSPGVWDSEVIARIEALSEKYAEWGYSYVEKWQELAIQAVEREANNVVVVALRNQCILPEEVWYWCMRHGRWKLGMWLLNWYTMVRADIIKPMFYYRLQGPGDFENIMMVCKKHVVNSHTDIWEQFMPEVLNTNCPTLWNLWKEQIPLERRVNCKAVLGWLQKANNISSDMLDYLEANSWKRPVEMYKMKIKQGLSTVSASAFAWALEGERPEVIARLIRQKRVKLSWVEELYKCMPELKETLGPCPLPEIKKTDCM